MMATWGPEQPHLYKSCYLLLLLVNQKENPLDCMNLSVNGSFNELKLAVELSMPF